MHAIIETNFFPFISSSLFLLLLLPPLLNLLSFSSSMFKLSCIDRRRSKETEQADQLSNQIPSEIQNPINFIRLDMEVMGDLDGRLKYAVWWWWRRRRRRRRRWRRRRRKKEKKEDDDRLQQQDAARRIVRRVHPSCNCAPRSPQFSSSDSFQIPLLLFYLPVFILVNIFNTIHCSINTCYKITGIGNRTGATPAPSAEIFQTDLNWQITRIATRIIASILTTWQYGKCVTHTHTLKMNPADAQWIFFLMRISWWWREDTVAGTFIRNADRPRYYRNHGRLFKCYALDYEFIYYLSFKCASWLSSSRLSALGNWRGRLFIDSVRIPRRWRLMNNWSEHRIIISVRKWLP